MSNIVLELTNAETAYFLSKIYKVCPSDLITAQKVYPSTTQDVITKYSMRDTDFIVEDIMLIVNKITSSKSI